MPRERFRADCGEEALWSGGRRKGVWFRVRVRVRGQGLRFGVWGFGFRVEGRRSRVGVWGAGFKV